MVAVYRVHFHDGQLRLPYQGSDETSAQDVQYETTETGGERHGTHFELLLESPKAQPHLAGDTRQSCQHRGSLLRFIMNSVCKTTSSFIPAPCNSNRASFSSREYCRRSGISSVFLSRCSTLGLYSSFLVTCLAHHAVYRNKSTTEALES